MSTGCQKDRQRDRQTDRQKNRKKDGKIFQLTHQNQGFSLDFHFSIFPNWCMRKMNQFPLVEKDFPTNFKKITKMGMEIGTNFQCGNIDLIQFPVWNNRH